MMYSLENKQVELAIIRANITLLTSMELNKIRNKMQIKYIIAEKIVVLLTASILFKTPKKGNPIISTGTLIAKSIKKKLK